MCRQLAGSGWECHVVVPAPARLADEYASAGITLHIVPMRRLTTSGGAGRWPAYLVGWPPAVLRLARLAKRLDVAVIHSNSLHSWYGWAVAALLRRPHIWHAREIVFQSGMALRVERALARHFADQVAAVSAAVAAQLDPGNVRVITDEPDGSEFRPDRAGRFRKSAGIPDDIPLLGSVARIDTWKGFDVLLDAYPAIRSARPDVELVIAGGTVPGKEEYASRLQRLAGSLPGVHWLGERRDVADIMSDLDVFVQVSTEPEPFGLVVVEALASGVPVVAGAEGGPVEIFASAVTGGPARTGHLVAPGDPAALQEAVDDLLPTTPSSVLERQARTRLRQPQADGFAALFDELASRGRRRCYWREAVRVPASMSR